MAENNKNWYYFALIIWVMMITNIFKCPFSPHQLILFFLIVNGNLLLHVCEKKIDL